MTEFRIFCIGGFVGAGLISAAGNRGWINPGDPFVQTIAGALLAGFLAVIMFGKRSHAD